MRRRISTGRWEGRCRSGRAAGVLRVVAALLLLLWPAVPAVAARACSGPAAASPRRVEHILAGGGPAVRRVVRRVEGAVGGPLVPLGARSPTVDCAELRRVVAHLPLRRPVRHAHVTSGFGTRVDPFTGRGARHEGIDFEARFGTPVRATAPGRVVVAGFRGGYGRMVEIDHGNGVHTRYGHLSALLVHRGQRVAAGQAVGREGSSGRSTGPHVHYEVRVDDVAIDPAPLLRVGERLRRAGISARG